MGNTVVLACIMTFLVFDCLAQNPKDGTYQSSDGSYRFSLTALDESTFEVTEPNKKSVYKKNGSVYQNTDPQYSNFAIKVKSPTELSALKGENSNEVGFSWVGNGIVASKDCPLAEKYEALAENDNDPEVQAYTFCALTAQVKCSYTAEGFAAYVPGVVIMLKPIVVNKSKCPCTDVISQSDWDAN